MDAVVASPERHHGVSQNVTVTVTLMDLEEITRKCKRHHALKWALAFGGSRLACQQPVGSQLAADGADDAAMPEGPEQKFVRPQFQELSRRVF